MSGKTKGRRWSYKDAIKFYIETNFSKKLTSQKLGINHITLHRALKGDPEFQKLFNEAEELRLDMAEEALNNLAAQEDMRAVKFLLDRKGRSRGYGEKVEVVNDENNRKFSSVKITDNGKIIELK